MVKKATQESITSKLALVMRSGKAVLGTKTTLKSIRTGKAKLVFISNNCPPLRKSLIQYYAMLAKIKTYLFPGNNNDLGTACGKFHAVSCLSILDAGDSDILTAE
mmetsp:Transcript_158/g.128  ORF Transcript_158/g.128 Transcript_158/m.128 type:complete len:105 (-) Transcript_158:201-515(-)|eukprot:CAMPEP_0114575198 /NCGR_PEP_ID=MMETSP0125-20121206/107_1 /TAXON_ID=485358 ORGANISM="Aristerostoma sp., Strain ATCC 50986" /NCGR_SAMPLE_ID=MMETSP0125 /ASSEMBLY_ACC=CAM_ASM_000245 /LENGTH=104 /DNA_ID=CAMNT_0001762767 /DNA_START=58 /DNA_END=372 /DNA_ORIENTATION=-